MYVLALSDYKQLAAAAGYKPAPQLGRQIAIYEKKASHNLELCNAFIVIKLLSYLS